MLRLRPLVLALVAATAAPAAFAADPIFPAASRVGLVPPPDFVVSTAFVGFQHNDKQARIAISELPDYAYDKLAEQADKAGPFKHKDVTLSDGVKAIYFWGVDDSPQGPVLKWMLLARAKQVTALVSAMVPSAIQDAAPEAAMRAALLSTTIRDSVPLQEQLSVLPFSMNELANFRIVRVQPGAAAMLTDGPKDAVQPTEQPLLIVSIGPMQSAPPPAERDSFARRAFGEMPGVKDVRIVRSEPLRIATAQGYEIVAEGKDAETGDDLMAVQWLRFGTGTLLRVVGVSRKESWEKEFNRFRAVRDGIGPR